MTHEELQDLLPAYALDALGPSEEMEVRAHLVSCEACRSILDPLVDAAGALALLAPPQAPPPGLKDRLLAEAARSSGDRPAPIAPVTLPRRPVWPRVAAAIAAAAVIVMAVVSFRLANRLDEQEQLLAEQRGLVELLASGSASTTRLVPAEEDSSASGEIVLASNSRSAGIVMAGLPDPGDDVYQLWLLEDGRPVPLDSFRPDDGGAAVVYVEANLESMSGMAVTREEEPALPAPQGPAVLRSA